MSRLLLLIGLPLLAQTVQVAPYYPTGTGTQNISTSAITDTSIDIVNSGSMVRTLMPRSGPIAKVSIPLGNVSSLVTFYPATYTCGAMSANVCTSWTANYGAAITGPFAANSLNTFTLATPLVASKWDATGGRLEFSQPHAASLTLATAQLFPAIGGSQGVKTTAETCYYQLNVSKPSTIATSGLTLIPNAACPVIGYYMAPPKVAGIGDSILGSAGAPGDSVSDTFAEVYPIPSVLSPLHFWLAGYAGAPITYQSDGWSGQTAAEIQALISADTLSLKSPYVLIEGGVNDLSACDSSAGCTGPQVTAIEGYLTSMMSAVQALGAIPVIMLIGPWNQSNGSNARMTSADTINANTISVASSYGAAVVDWRCTVGQFRATQHAGNCWDYQPAYLVSDGLGIHPNQAGVALIGALMTALIPSLSPSIARPGNGVAW